MFIAKEMKQNRHVNASRALWAATTNLWTNGVLRGIVIEVVKGNVCVVISASQRNTLVVMYLECAPGYLIANNLIIAIKEIIFSDSNPKYIEIMLK